MSSNQILESEVTPGVGSSTNGEVKLDCNFLNNLFTNVKTKDGEEGYLELGPTLLDIRKGLKIVMQKKKNDDETAAPAAAAAAAAACISPSSQLFKYTIMLYISRGALNNAVQFLEIESALSQKEIIAILFKHLKYKLPSDEKLNKRCKKDGTSKYLSHDEQFHWIEISEDHAYVYVGGSDGKCYENSFVGSLDFIYRIDPENKPSL